MVWSHFKGLSKFLSPQFNQWSTTDNGHNFPSISQIKSYIVFAIWLNKLINIYGNWAKTEQLLCKLHLLIYCKSLSIPFDCFSFIPPPHSRAMADIRFSELLDCLPNNKTVYPTREAPNTNTHIIINKPTCKSTLQLQMVRPGYVWGSWKL